MELLFIVVGDLISSEVAFTVMRLIEQDCHEEMQKSTVDLYIDVVQSGSLLSNVFCYCNLSYNWKIWIFQ
jgi:AP-4 complex subunit epsilon-1